jgi:hypothetical protein
MKTPPLLLVALFLAPTAHSQEAKLARYTGPKEKLHIYILVGQSNMSGRARVETEDREIPKNLFLLDSQGGLGAGNASFIQYTNVPNGADENAIKAKGKTGLNLGLAFARRSASTACISTSFNPACRWNAASPFSLETLGRHTA